jgi:hypothetical protein
LVGFLIGTLNLPAFYPLIVGALNFLGVLLPVDAEPSSIFSGFASSGSNILSLATPELAESESDFYSTGNND